MNYEEVTNTIKGIADDHTDVSISVRDWVRDTAHKTFRTNDILRDLCSSTGGHERARFRSAMHSCLGRMVTAGKVVRLQDTGHYRKIEGDLLKMDFLNAPREEYGIVFPFEIPNRVFPGNVVVVAGQPNSGKTSLLLNIVKLNMYTHKIHYFNCEMGNTELAERLDAFEGVELSDWNFNAYERNGDFAEVIQVNDLNIIDYMDDKEAFAMKDKMHEIHDKMRKKEGITIIAIQKHKHKEFGYGGEGTTQIPRLYMNLKWDEMNRSGIVTLIKAKNWRGEENPNGKMQRYWIYDKGSRWEVDGPWRYPEDESLMTKAVRSK